jgi:RHS repeat-associated protein
LRVKKVSGSTTTVYIFSGSKVIAEYDNGAAPTTPSREYIYGGGTLLAKIDSSGTKYYHQDHLSNRLVTSSTGTTLEQMGHFPFGDPWYNATNDKLYFTSYERDAESGNDYAMARYYVWRVGRFLTPDPAGLAAFDPANPQTSNQYEYVLNDPIDLEDPLGLYPVCKGGGLYDQVDYYVDGVFQGSDLIFTGNPCGHGTPFVPNAGYSGGGGGGDVGRGGGNSRCGIPPFLPCGNTSSPSIPTPAEAATKFCEDQGQISRVVRGTGGTVPTTLSASFTIGPINYNTKNEITPVIPAIPWPEWLSFGAGLDFSFNAPKGSAPTVNFGLGRNLGVSLYRNAQGKTTGININLGPSIGPPVSVSPGSANACGLRAGG